MSGKRRGILIARSFAHFLLRWTGRAAAALPAIYRALHNRVFIRARSYAADGPRGQGPSQLFSALYHGTRLVLPAISRSYAEHESYIYLLSSSCPADIISPYENEPFFHLSENTIPHTYKNVPLILILT